jgi:organic radical activating enzyme
MSRRYFPIKTETACQLKWTWSTIKLFNAVTNSCHRVNPDRVTADTFANFHNTAKKLADRQLMLDGQWPTGGCEYCKNIEDAGGHSDRMMHLEIPDLTPPELETDISAVSVTPRILEVYFDNLCNMSCLYCTNTSSSRIDYENRLHGVFDRHGVVIKNDDEQSNQQQALGEALWTWMQDHAHTLARFHVLGGEPFYQDQFDRCLDFFDRNPCPDLELNVVSNLMISSTRLEHIIGTIKKLMAQRKLKRFDLTCSIDSFGREQEYVRYGLDLEQWKKNFEYVVSQRWIYLNFNQVLSVLTLKQVPDLLYYIDQQRQHRKIHHHFGTPVMTHDFLHPDIFGQGYFDPVFDEILKAMPDTTEQEQSARNYMLGIQGQINSKSRDQDAINRLGVYLDEIDRRRGLDWRQTFPWLVKEVEHVV